MADRCAARAAAASLLGLVLVAGCASSADRDEAVAPGPTAETAATTEAAPVEPTGAANRGLLASADPGTLACADAGLADAGIDAAALDAWPGAPADVETVFQIAFECLPGGGEHPILVEHLERTMERVVSWVVDFDAEQATCASDHLLAATGQPGRLLGVRDDALLVPALRACITEDQLDAVVDYAADIESSDPEGRLVDLHRGCSTAYRQECDLLRLLAPQGMRTPAEDCGGSPLSATGFCAIEIDLDLTGYSPPTNRGLETLESSCEDGRLNSCDSLRLIAPIGSPLVELGRTCAGLVPEGAVPDCRAAFEGGRPGGANDPSG